MSPDTIKCRDFLSTLIRLAGAETPKNASIVKKLVQNLIDGVIEPEEFSTQMQKELQCNHQPLLYHFLKKSLQNLRQALISGEMVIEGIRPPPVPAFMQSLVPTTKEEYFQLHADNFLKIQKEMRENYLKREEMEMQQQVVPILSTNSLAATPTTVGKSEDFSNENGNLKSMLQKRLRIIRREYREKVKKIVADLKESEAPGLEGDKRKDIPEEHSVIKSDPEKIKKEFDEVSIQMEQLENKINEMKKMLEESGIYAGGLNLNRKRTPSEFANSTRDSDRIEERRYFVRREVSNNRRNNQLRAANLSRGLFMEEDSQEVSESDQTFNLTSLDEALPSVSNRSKKVPGMKRRSLKLQDMVMNSIKDNRLRLTVEALCSMGTMSGENS